MMINSSENASIVFPRVLNSITWGFSMVQNAAFFVAPMKFSKNIDKYLSPRDFLPI